MKSTFIGVSFVFVIALLAALAGCGSSGTSGTAETTETSINLTGSVQGTSVSASESVPMSKGVLSPKATVADSAIECDSIDVYQLTTGTQVITGTCASDGTFTLSAPLSKMKGKASDETGDSFKFRGFFRVVSGEKEYLGFLEQTVTSGTTTLTSDAINADSTIAVMDMLSALGVTDLSNIPTALAAIEATATDTLAPGCEDSSYRNSFKEMFLGASDHDEFKKNFGLNDGGDSTKAIQVMMGTFDQFKDAGDWSKFDKDGMHALFATYGGNYDSFYTEGVMNAHAIGTVHGYMQQANYDNIGDATARRQYFETVGTTFQSGGWDDYYGKENVYMATWESQYQTQGSFAHQAYDDTKYSCMESCLAAGSSPPDCESECTVEEAGAAAGFGEACVPGANDNCNVDLNLACHQDLSVCRGRTGYTCSSGDDCAKGLACTSNACAAPVEEGGGGPPPAANISNCEANCAGINLHFGNGVEGCMNACSLAENCLQHCNSICEANKDALSSQDGETPCSTWCPANCTDAE